MRKWIVQQKRSRALRRCEEACYLEPLNEKDLILRRSTQVVGGLQLRCLRCGYLYCEVAIHEGF